MYVSHGVKPFLTYLWPPLLIDPRAAPDTRVSGRWVNEGTERYYIISVWSVESVWSECGVRVESVYMWSERGMCGVSVESV